jgi:hypothetical protein
MNKIFPILISILVTGFVGCSHPGAVERHFGDSYREALARTTDDPEGSAANADRPAPSGLDGTTASQVIDRHRETLQPASGPSLPLPMIVTGSDSLGDY